MENQLYRMPLNNGHEIEFDVAVVSGPKEYDDARAIGVTVLGPNGFQLDGDLENDACKSLIKFLTEANEYVQSFNNNKLPKLNI